MPLRMVAITTLLGASLPLSAGDFWRDKEPSQWTEREVRDLLAKSPWAKRVTAGFDAVQRTGMPSERGGGRGGGRGGWGGGAASAGGGMGNPGMGGGGWGGGGRGQGGWGGGGGREESGSWTPPEFTVRWESAAPVREALNRIEAPDLEKITAWSKDFYVISVSGLRTPGQGQWRGEGQDQAERQARLKQATVLLRKGKDPTSAERIERLETPEARVLVFLFPRTAGIAAEDKEIEFQTAFGPMQIRAKFKPKEMLFHAAPAL